MFTLLSFWLNNKGHYFISHQNAFKKTSKTAVRYTPKEPDQQIYFCLD